MDSMFSMPAEKKSLLSKVLSIRSLLTSAKCEQGHGFVKRADTEKLADIFNKYASIDQDGEKFMTSNDFIVEYLGISTDNEDTRDCLAGCADTTKDGLISFIEFQAFESLLSAPDAIYALAFQLFDTNNSGHISFDEFASIIKKTELYSQLNFSFESDFMKLYFGMKKDRDINYTEFTQLLSDFHEEYTLQAFHAKDTKNSGFITAVDFYEIMCNLKGHLLTNFVKENLLTVAGGGKGTTNISYPFFTACISLLDNMDLVKLIYTSGCSQIGNIEMTKEEFLREAQNYSKVTPLEVDILFQFIDLQHQNGRIEPADLNLLAPIEQDRMPYSLQRQAIQEMVQESYEGKGRGVLVQIMESGYRFALGSVAGAFGATAVYPIDLVKTRMQNQRTGGAMVGELMYKNSFDCFQKVIRYEGVTGLYRGIVPQLIGVAPEKAIKLTMNDFMRGKLTSKDGTLPLRYEMLSGCCAGASQVMITNPLEIVKIRLQVAGEIISSRKIGAISVIRELGLFGLYKGSTACFLRDIPFSAIYFTSYANLKKKSANENGENSALTLFLSATIAGAPAACLTTPADVIKTRLQVVARAGQTQYNGLIDTAKKIFAEEGGSAFFKGAPARVLRSSPQFGFTLLVYEQLQKLLYVDFGGKGSKKTKQILPENSDHIGGYRLALATFQGLEVKYGICLPKFGPGI